MSRDARPAAAELASWLEATLGGPPSQSPDPVARLWAGYGRVVRVHVAGEPRRTAILKQVRFPRESEGHRGHARKVQSYRVERAFYEQHVRFSESRARTPLLYGAREADDEVWLLLEDLDGAGFSARPRSGEVRLAHAGLEWLAGLHAAHLGRAPTGLWPEGSYWQLATRPDELRAILGHALHRLAPELDRRLRDARFRTLVHGDPKLENFCRTPSGEPSLAAFDFQYAGGGVGVRDVVYFIGSAVEPGAVERELPALLDHYFTALGSELARRAAETGEAFDGRRLEAEWRELVPVAWLDFYRFTLGWSPAWAKSDVYGRRLLERLGPGV